MSIETEAPSMSKRLTAFSVSAFFVMSKIVTAIFKTNLNRNNLTVGLILLGCRTVGVMTTTAKGNYDSMTKPEPKSSSAKEEKEGGEVNLESFKFPIRMQFPAKRIEIKFKDREALTNYFTKEEKGEPKVLKSSVENLIDECRSPQKAIYPLILYCDQPEKELIYLEKSADLLVYLNQRYYLNLMHSLVMPVSVLNALMQSSFSAYASYLVILAVSASSPAAMAFAVSVFTIGMFICMYFAKDGIGKTFRAFGKYLDSDEKFSLDFASVGKFLFALCALSSVPLLYISLHTPLMAFFMLAGVSASLCNPISIAICVFLLMVSVAASIGINYSQGSKFKEAFSKLRAKFNSMEGFWSKALFSFSFLIAAVICGATIAIAVMGDVLGLKSVFNLTVVPVMLFALTSFICNAAFTLSDCLLRVTMSLTYLFSFGNCEVPESDSDESGSEQVSEAETSESDSEDETDTSPLSGNPHTLLVNHSKPGPDDKGIDYQPVAAGMG